MPVNALTPGELKRLEAEMEGWVLPKILEEKAIKNGDKIFLNICSKRYYTYRQTNERANQVGRFLQKIGVTKGDKVAIFLPNSEHYIFSWFGIHKIGAVQVPINTAYKGEFLEYAIDFSDSVVLITSPGYLERVVPIQNNLPKLRHILVVTEGNGWSNPGINTANLLTFDEAYNESTDNTGVEVRFSDPERIMFTSGTTGRSKGVFRSHAAAYWSGRNYVDVLQVRSDDVLFTALPLFHANAQVLCVYPALLADASVAIYERFSATQLWDWCRESGATIFNILGAMSYFLYNQPPSEKDADNPVRLIMAAPAPKDIYFEFEKRFNVKFTEGYGLTETGMVTYMPPEAPRVGSIGKAAPGYEVKIVDEDDREVPPNTTGEIVIRNQLPWLMVTEYYRMPEKTASDFRNLWFHTGDAGRMDEDGYFYFMDRKKDYIRRRAENVSSFEVEKVVNSHPAVSESAAIGIPAGEGAVAEDEIKIVVVLEPGARLTPVELIQWCEERMPYFMIPRYVEFVESLPKTPTEKVRKHLLREAGVTPQTWDREKAGYKIKR
ncbi:MAG: ATP-dependent acyl-CoA ligase [Thermoanaerobacteraceae bacterium]|nr:ATP-dependent acyl-CoA ligase [Thermoanaerobacteraceae bacterium]